MKIKKIRQSNNVMVANYVLINLENEIWNYFCGWGFANKDPTYFWKPPLHQGLHSYQGALIAIVSYIVVW